MVFQLPAHKQSVKGFIGIGKYMQTSSLTYASPLSFTKMTTENFQRAQQLPIRPRVFFFALFPVVSHQIANSSDLTLVLLIGRVGLGYGANVTYRSYQKG